MGAEPQMTASAPLTVAELRDRLASGALDALTRTQMQAWFEKRWRAARWTTLLVTHDVREAVALSDRIFVLSRRPAHVLTEVQVPGPRPRLGRRITPEAHALEAQVLDILLNQTGKAL